nr:hypothetical protein [Candidatus Sigynarchaeota archaeon]
MDRVVPWPQVEEGVDALHVGGLDQAHAGPAVIRPGQLDRRPGDDLLAEDDLRKYARIIFFAPMEEFARYKSLEKDECPECTDSCYQRSVSFYAENAESLPVDLYPIHTAFVAKVRGLLPQARCTLRYHQVTCENCEGEVFPKYAVLVSIYWEGLTISREYDPFSTQQ